MADEISFSIDNDFELERTLNQLGALAQPFINEASAVSAAHIVTEAKARLRRQLTGGDSTGQTEAAITSRPAFDNNGSVVVVERDYMPNLPLWIEKGTQSGKRKNRATTPARPFFYAAAALEVEPHAQRLRVALQDAVDAQGLGA